MKRLTINSLQYQYLEQNFKEWLQTLGYAVNTVYNSPNHLREFFYYLERQDINKLHKIRTLHIEMYYQNLRERHHQRKSGNLSNSYINKHLQTLKNFSVYLKETGQGNLEINLQQTRQELGIKAILNKEEIKGLYKACETTAIDLMDRAMLAIFYGCGLRRNEGVQLQTQDIQNDRIYVRKGKNYKERYVPINEAIKHDLDNYLMHGRPFFLNHQKTSSFFISNKGKPIDGQSLNLRLKELCRQANIHKNISLHSLRHSVATHLLQSGMKLAQIARFLGHSSLESTQIYTRLSTEY